MICRTVTRLNLVTCTYLFWETDYNQPFQINLCHQLSEYVVHSAWGRVRDLAQAAFVRTRAFLPRLPEGACTKHLRPTTQLA